MFFLSVALFVLCQPSVLFEDGLSFCAFFAYIPFFLLLERISPKISLLWGAFYGALAYFCLCWWLSAFGAVAISFVCVLFAFYNAALFFFISFCRANFPPRFGRFFWIFRACLVLAVEFLRTHGIFGFSYGIIGYSQWKNPLFLRFSSLFGVLGVSFLILLVNSLAAKIISERNLKENLKKCAFLLSFFGAIFLFWRISPLLESKTAPKRIRVALVQNASSAPSCSISDYENDAVLLQKLSDEALSKNPETRLVVWAETAIVPDILRNMGDMSEKRRHALSKNLVDYFKSKNCAFLIGNNYSDAQGTHNAALLFSPDSENVSVYCKNHLVPFTEFWPSFLDFKMFDGIKESLNCDFFTHGSGISLFEVDSLRFATPICFEDSFSPLMRKMKKSGADFFVNISDDAWSRQKSAQNMHLSMSAFRCAEFGTPMIRSTIDGVTCAIDSNGKIFAVLKNGIDGFLCVNFPVPTNRTTLYQLWGDGLWWILLTVVFAVMLILLVKFYKMNLYGRR